jgi:hypothetical protein
MVAAIGRGEGQHLGVLDRVPRSVRLNLFVPRCRGSRGTPRGGSRAHCSKAYRSGTAAPRTTHAMLRIMEMPRSQQASRSERPTRAFPSLQNARAKIVRERKHAAHHSDHGSADVIRRPLVPPGSPSSRQALLGVLLVPLAGGLGALPPRLDEPLDRRRHRRSWNLRSQARR